MTFNPINLGQEVFRSAEDAANGATAWAKVAENMARGLPSRLRQQEKFVLPSSVHFGVEKFHKPLINAAKDKVRGLVPENLITAPVVSHFQANIDTQIHNLFGALHVSGPMGGVGEHLFRFATTHITNLL